MFHYWIGMTCTSILWWLCSCSKKEASFTVSLQPWNGRKSGDCKLLDAETSESMWIRLLKSTVRPHMDGCTWFLFEVKKLIYTGDELRKGCLVGQACNHGSSGVAYLLKLANLSRTGDPIRRETRQYFGSQGLKTSSFRGNKERCEESCSDV